MNLREDVELEINEHLIDLANQVAEDIGINIDEEEDVQDKHGTVDGVTRKNSQGRTIAWKGSFMVEMGTQSYISNVTERDTRWIERKEKEASCKEKKQGAKRKINNKTKEK